MLSREQLLYLFDRFSTLISQSGINCLPSLSNLDKNVFSILAKKFASELLSYEYFIDVKKRIADAVSDNQEAVAVTTKIQEEILQEMGVDPTYGLACLGKINMDYENDQDLMLRFYTFVAKEEMACEEAELGEDEYREKIEMQNKLHQQQLEMLKEMRNYGVDVQSAILDKVREQMEKEDFESEASVLSAEHIQEIVKNRV